MRTIIAGSRSCNDYCQVLHAVRDCGWRITAVISGRARGVDRLGERWANEHCVPLELFAAKWREQGPAAGHVRNALMADNADALIALWDSDSPGTKGMIDIAVRKGLLVHVHFV